MTKQKRKKPTGQEINFETWLEILQSPTVILPAFATLAFTILSAPLSYVATHSATTSSFMSLLPYLSLLAGLGCAAGTVASLFLNGKFRFKPFKQRILQKYEDSYKQEKVEKLQYYYDVFSEKVWEGKQCDITLYKKLGDFIAEFVKIEETFYSELENSEFDEDSKQSLVSLQEKIFTNSLDLLGKLHKLDEVRSKMSHHGTLDIIKKEIKATEKKKKQVTNPEYLDAYEQKIRTLKKKLDQLEGIESKIETLLVRLNKGKMLLEEATLEFYNVDGTSSNMDHLTQSWQETMEVAVATREELESLDREGDLDRILG